MKNQTGERRKNTSKEMMKGDEWVRGGERVGKKTKRGKETEGVHLQEGIRKFKAVLQVEFEG